MEAPGYNDGDSKALYLRYQTQSSGHHLTWLVCVGLLHLTKYHSLIKLVPRAFPPRKWEVWEKALRTTIVDSSLITTETVSFIAVCIIYQLLFDQAKSIRFHVIHTVIHAAASQSIDTRQTLGCASVNTDNIMIMFVAFPGISASNILIIAFFVAVWMNARLTASGPLNTPQLVTPTPVESKEKMPGRTGSPSFPRKNNNNLIYA